MNAKYLPFILILFAACAWTTFGQEPEEIPKVEVFGGYSLLRSEGANFNGWKAGVDVNINRWFAIAVDGDGYYHSELTESGKLTASEHSLTAGPHFSFRNKSKFVPYVYTLAGAAWEKSSEHGISESASGFAFETGGGVDWDATKTISIRIIDIGASITRIGGVTATKPKFTTGIVFKFGKR